MWFDPTKLGRARPSDVAEVAKVATPREAENAEFAFAADEPVPPTPATLDQSLEQSVAAVAIVANTPGRSESLPSAAEQSIRRWLAHIGESDAGIIDEVIQRCRASEDARDFFLKEASMLTNDDDRVTCATCLNLAAAGRCLAAARGQIPCASPQYSPIPELKRRCEAYRPHRMDPDQRTGTERWPGLLRISQPPILE